MQREKACRIYSILAAEYLDEDTNLNFLDFDNPFQILVMTILSAQTTDKMVNSVKDDLFSKYTDPAALSQAKQEDVEKIIKKTGFFRAKAKNIIASSKILVRDFGGEVPRTMEELVTLPGVGRKTANIVLNHAFGIDEGIAVDTHVKRVSWRIGLTDNTDPVKIERDLTALFSKEAWGKMNYLLISHGRAVCTARNPACERCAIKDYCRFFKDNCK
ncbi:endonuclease III [Methanolacinia petrolearia]|uniref:endonuclease III n=1 Tax=Methanolacinia petrolearia TaxID=54120 RepID=UPI003BACED67